METFNYIAMCVISAILTACLCYMFVEKYRDLNKPPPMSCRKMIEVDNS